jgi:putative transposase
MSPTSYPQRHHPRLAGFDYRTPGYYFITICVQQRLRLFGGIKQGTMHPNPAGVMVQEAWTSLVALHPGVAIDIVMVMPDHVHAVVVLEDDTRRELSLSDVILRYKSLTTKRYAHGVRDGGWEPFAGRLWQESFYNHVILIDEELDVIRRYIAENPLRWELKRGGSEQGRDGEQRRNSEPVT